MHYFFTSESVSSAHPDKICDFISDRILSQYLAFDSESHCAVETMITTDIVIIAGEIKSKAKIDVESVVRNTIKEVGYTKENGFDYENCKVLNLLHEQSPDIDMGVTKENPENQGAGDQNQSFGFGICETDEYIKLTSDLSNKIIKELEIIRKQERELMPYLRPDAKSQVTVEYDEDDKPVRVDAIVVSTQHDEFADDETMLTQIRKDIINIVIPRVKAKYSENIQKLFNDDIRYYVNPTGRFVLGGPSQDTGLTGRKIIVDSTLYISGGGCFSGKDASKQDRSGAYMARYIAKNAVAAGLSDKMLVQISYAIGVAEPVSFYVNTYRTSKLSLSDGEIAQKLQTLFDLRPYAIIRDLKLKNPIYEETSSGGHFGRIPELVHKHFESRYGDSVELDVELFTWEKLDAVDKIKAAFGLTTYSQHSAYLH